MQVILTHSPRNKTQLNNTNILTAQSSTFSLYFVYLFICGSFNDPVSSTDYTASKDMINNE
jgi:hypothetical protein